VIHYHLHTKLLRTINTTIPVFHNSALLRTFTTTRTTTNNQPNKMPPQSVDTHIHNSTSGLAALTAQSHSQPASTGLTLYSGWFCPFVQRVWIYLEEKSISYRYFEINPYHKDEHFLKLNPRGLVPTLTIAEKVGKGGSEEEVTGKVKGEKVREKVLFESTVILDYLDAVYSESEGGKSMYPADAYEKARLRIWMDHAATRIVPAFYRFIQHTPEKNYTLDDMRREFRDAILTWTRELDGEGPFAAGKEFGMGDVILVPWALRIGLIDHYKTGGSGVPLRMEDVDGAVRQGNGKDDGERRVWERWVKWHQAVSERKSVKRTMSEWQQYVDVYQRYAEDTTGSGVGSATRGNRGLP
jgi:glutathione S-transferase